jgi:nitric oxide reductase subunit B
MWAVGCLFFIYTFCEQHAYLLPGVFSDPIVDKRIQWKACGTLVGSFNLFVYGSLIYIGEKTSGDKSYGNSKIAYSLFGIGLLNSFTNYAHHTYHLPQSHLVKWVAFVISMLEIIILFRVIWDIARSVSVKQRVQYNSMTHWINASKWWTGAMLFSSILISIPPLNALIHGTYVVTAHAMGTMIGIDSIILLGTSTYLLGEFLGKQSHSLHNAISRVTVIGLNLGTGALVIWLNFVGITDGYYRYFVPRNEAYHRPEWLENIASIGFAVAGIVTFIFFALLVIRWIRLVSRPPTLVKNNEVEWARISLQAIET